MDGTATRRARRAVSQVSVAVGGQADRWLYHHGRRCSFKRAIHISAGCFSIRRRWRKITSSTPGFPIVHVVGIRRELAEEHPGLPGAVLKAFEQAKELGLRKPSDTSATKVTVPFVEERLKERVT